MWRLFRGLAMTLLVAMATSQPCRPTGLGREYRSKASDCPGSATSHLAPRGCAPSRIHRSPGFRGVWRDRTLQDADGGPRSGAQRRGGISRSSIPRRWSVTHQDQTGFTPPTTRSTDDITFNTSLQRRSWGAQSVRSKRLRERSAGSCWKGNTWTLTLRFPSTEHHPKETGSAKNPEAPFENKIREQELKAVTWIAATRGGERDEPPLPARHGQGGNKSPENDAIRHPCCDHGRPQRCS